jgi:CheY-like chemotaxis protein
MPVVAEPPTPRAIAAPAKAGRPLRVLVADDVAANRMVARAMLVAAGHRVDSASDGAEALSAVERESYDIVLMDVQMPNMDGLEATRRIRGLAGPVSRVPILAVTASALPEQVAACHEAGMDGHLAKPIDRESLLSAVRRLAAGDTLGSGEHAAPARPEPPLLDEAALTTLASDLGPTAEVVIGEFISELRLGLETLATPEIAEDRTRLRQAAHRLLGAARTLGARRLARAIETMQATVSAGTPPREPLARVLAAGIATLPAIEQARQSEAAPKQAQAQAERGEYATQGNAA